MRKVFLRISLPLIGLYLMDLCKGSIAQTNQPSVFRGIQRLALVLMTQPLFLIISSI
jgi:hypothetical protein